MDHIDLIFEGRSYQLVKIHGCDQRYQFLHEVFFIIRSLHYSANIIPVEIDEPYLNDST